MKLYQGYLDRIRMIVDTACLKCIFNPYEFTKVGSTYDKILSNSLDVEDIQNIQKVIKYLINDTDINDLSRGVLMDTYGYLDFTLKKFAYIPLATCFPIRNTF